MQATTIKSWETSRGVWKGFRCKFIPLSIFLREEDYWMATVEPVRKWIHSIRKQDLKAFNDAGLTWKVCLMPRARFSVLIFQISGWGELSTKASGFWWRSKDWMGFRCSSTWNSNEKKKKKRIWVIKEQQTSYWGRHKGINREQWIQDHSM